MQFDLFVGVTPALRTWLRRAKQKKTNRMMGLRMICFEAL
jgi:hypothetical protein